MQELSRRRLLECTPLAAAVLAGCSGTDDSSAPPSGGTSSPPADEPTETTPAADTSTEGTPEPDTPEGRSTRVRLGEVVSGQRLSMVVRSVRSTDSIGQYQQADQGNTYVVVRLVVKNTTRSEFASFSSFLQVELQDSEGYTYNPTLAVTESDFEDGQLAPGEVTRGDVVFEVPDDASDLTLQFDFTAFAFTVLDRVTVDLASEAASVGDLQQSLHVTLHGVGEAVTKTDVTVTVNSIEFQDSLGQYAQPPEGREYAVVDVTTANDSDEVVAFSSLLQMAMKDGTGRAFQPSTTGTSQLSRRYSGGEVQPGGRVRGQLAFAVPVDASPLYFTFEYSLVNDGTKTFWQLR